MQTAAKVSVSEIALVLLLTKRVGELSEEQTNSVGKEDNENAPKTTDHHVQHSTTENRVASNKLFPRPRELAALAGVRLRAIEMGDQPETNGL